MIQVKHIADRNTVTFEQRVNDFLRTVEKIVDIKFSSSNDYTEALIIYKTEAAE